MRDGDWTDYDDTDLLTVRRGQQPRIPLRLAQYAAEDRAALESLVDGDAGLPLQVGIPGYLDMALFAFGPVGAIRHSSRLLPAVERSPTRSASTSPPSRATRASLRPVCPQWSHAGHGGR